MKSTKNRAISIMICLLMLAQIVPSSWSSVSVFAYSPEPEEMANTKNDIDLPIDPFHVLSYVSAKPATCTDSGNKAYYACSDCGKWFEDSLGTVEITDKSSVVIPAAEHTPAEAVRENEVAATCCAAGSYDEVIYCSVCHEEVSREPKTIPIDEDAHDWGEWEAISETHHARVCQTDESHTGQARHDFVGGICADCGYKKPGVTFVSGTVTSFGSETDNVILQLIAEGYSEADYEAIVKGNTATYSIGGVAPGTYTLRVVKNNHVTREYTVVVSIDDVIQDAKIHLLGDVTGDGNVDVRDLIRLKKIMSKLAESNGAPEDINNDGNVDSVDLAYLRKYLLGITF